MIFIIIKKGRRQRRKWRCQMHVESTFTSETLRSDFCLEFALSRFIFFEPWMWLKFFRANNPRITEGGKEKKKQKRENSKCKLTSHKLVQISKVFTRLQIYDCPFIRFLWSNMLFHMLLCGNISSPILYQNIIFPYSIFTLTNCMEDITCINKRKWKLCKEEWRLISWWS